MILRLHVSLLQSRCRPASVCHLPIILGIVACVATAMVDAAAYSVAPQATDQPRCMDFPEFEMQNSIRYRFTDEDAAVYLDAVEPGADTSGWDLVLVVSLPDTSFGRSLGGFEVPYVAVAGTQGCLRGRKFLGPIKHQNALAMVNRRRANKSVAVPALEGAAAAGDAEAKALLGIRRAIQRGDRSGWDLVLEAAEQNVGLAIIALAYWTSGEGNVYPPGVVDPSLDRPAAFCWSSVGLQSTDPDIHAFSESLIRALDKTMSKDERDAGGNRWNRARATPAHPSCR